MKYHFKIYRQGRGLWAECLELKGCVTQGDSVRHLNEMMRDALAAYLGEPESSRHIFPMPDTTLRGRGVMEVPVEPRVALAMLIRQNRLGRGLTQKVAAEKLGMKHLYQYQKLEAGKSANPELATLVKIKRLFPEFSVDAALA